MHLNIDCSYVGVFLLFGGGGVCIGQFFDCLDLELAGIFKILPHVILLRSLFLEIMVID